MSSVSFKHFFGEEGLFWEEKEGRRPAPKLQTLVGEGEDTRTSKRSGGKQRTTESLGSFLQLVRSYFDEKGIVGKYRRE
jgi:hypothetical protein